MIVIFYDFFFLYCYYNSLRIIQHQNFKITAFLMYFVVFLTQLYLSKCFFFNIYKTAILNAIFTKMVSKCV